MVRIERRTVLGVAALAGLAFATRSSAAAAPARVGWLGWTGASGLVPFAPSLEAFRSGLSDRGWQESRNLVLSVRSGEGPRARELATDLIRAGVDVLVAQGPMVFGARTVAASVPVVFSINGDPVEAGLVASLARPEANLTGVTALSAQLAEKRVEFIKDAVPHAVRIAAIANQSHPGVRIEQQASEAAAEKLGMMLQWVAIRGRHEFDAAFAAIEREKAAALIAVPDNLINDQAANIARFAETRRVPAISGWADFAEAGNLMSYGPNPRAHYRRVAEYVDKLLRGARPADLPVEQPTEFEFVVNLRAARAIGLTLPRSVLLRADRTIS